MDSVQGRYMKGEGYGGRMNETTDATQGTLVIPQIVESSNTAINHIYYKVSSKDCKPSHTKADDCGECYRKYGKCPMYK